MNKKGYISVNIEKSDMELLNGWVKINVPEDQLMYAEIRDERKGGVVIDDAHLTLFFGLKDDAVDKDAVQKSIDSLRIDVLEVVGIGVFPIESMGAKVLFFKIADDGQELRRAHNEFLKFEHDEDDYKGFIPHITIAYVKDSLVESRLKLEGRFKLKVKNIEYLTTC